MTRPGIAAADAIRSLAALLLAAILVLPATPALGWGGGATSYGTHDWVVDQAVRVLDGRADAWFDVDVAREASDDPDSVEDHGDPLINEHSYRDRGRRGGGVARTAYEYDLAQAAYQRGAAARGAGDETTAAAEFRDASYHIGLLSHFVADLSQPFHTAYGAIGRDRHHADYEALISSKQRSASAMPAWQSSRRSVRAISDIRHTIVATAAYSRGYWPELFKRLSNDGVRLTTRVSEITGALMKRATNDLADIIWSISQGVGAQPAIGRITMSVKWTGVRADDQNTVFVRAYDTRGNPIEGLRIDVAWPTADGTFIAYVYTDEHGYQMRHDTVGSRPRLALRPVVATATVRGITTRAERAWTISPRLASGGPGFRTTVSDATVVAGQDVTVTSLARDANGRGVPNLLVRWTWDDGTHKVRTSAYTDSTGRARSTRTITDTTALAKVTVTARTQSGSTNRSSSVTFRRVS